MTRSTGISLAASVLAILGAVAVRYHFEHSEATPRRTLSGTPRLALGQSVPDFRLPAPDGTLHALSEFRGRPLLINLWATWCHGCMEEMPLIRQLQAEYGRDRLVVLAIATDSEADVGRAIAEHRLEGLTVLIDSADKAPTVAPLAAALRVLPQTVLIDADQHLRGAAEGSFANIEQLRAFVEDGLAR